MARPQQRGVSFPRVFVDEVERCVRAHPEFGYRTHSEFLIEAGRIHLAHAATSARVGDVLTNPPKSALEWADYLYAEMEEVPRGELIAGRCGSRWSALAREIRALEVLVKEE